MLSCSSSATHHKLGGSALTTLHHADHVVSWGEVVDIQGQLTLPVMVKASCIQRRPAKS